MYLPPSDIQNYMRSSQISSFTHGEKSGLCLIRMTAAGNCRLTAKTKCHRQAEHSFDSRLTVLCDEPLEGRVRTSNLGHQGKSAEICG
jgi:hypothetical protein